MLNDLQIQQRAIRDQLIVPYNKHHLQPHSIDLTLGGHFQWPRAKNGIDATIYNESDGEWEEMYEEECVSIPPFAFVLGHTMETINMPNDLTADVQGKSTIGRRGLQIECAGLVDAGFCGQITLEMFNMTQRIMKLKIGMAICQLKFHEGEPAKIVDYKQKGHYCGQMGATLPHSIK